MITGMDLTVVSSKSPDLGVRHRKMTTMPFSFVFISALYKRNHATTHWA